MPLTLWTNWRTDREEILQTFYIFEFYHKIKLLFVFDCFDLEIFHPENEKVRSKFTIQEHKYRFKKKKVYLSNLKTTISYQRQFNSISNIANHKPNINTYT